jgi:ferredoxin
VFRIGCPIGPDATAGLGHREGVVTARRRIGLRLRVDPVACDAYGFCAELLPERITLDEWGYPIVDGTPVAADLLALATRAAAVCPRRALLLEEVTVVQPEAASAR